MLHYESGTPMDAPYIIDRQIFKIMKFIYRKHEVKLSLIAKKFGDGAIPLSLSLCIPQYAAYCSKDKLWTFDTVHTSPDGSIGLTSLGNKYVEDRREAFIKWFVPLVTSSISVAISMMALAVSIFLK